METKFPSKVDWWLRSLLSAVILFEIGVASVFLVAPPTDGPIGFLIAVACLAVAGFISWLLFSTYYVIGDKDLIARSGPFRFRVPLDAISEIVSSHDPLSAPALSLDRLRISYEKKGHSRSLLISPKDKEGFLRGLAAAVPGLHLEGDRLVTLG